MKRIGRVFVVISSVVAVGCGDGPQGPSNLLGGPQPTPSACTISQDQVLDPTLATEVPNGLGASLCDFNVFAWESFLYLVAPSENDPSLRRFQVDADYPQYAGEGQDSCSQAPSSSILTRAVAAPAPGPEAGTDSVIYSVTGDPTTDANLVVYNIRFGRDLCSDTSANLPSDLIEIKTAWRILSAGDDTSRYFTLETEYEGASVLLGLIGFHLVQATPLHPEMIWTSFEHVDNNPDCEEGAAAPAAGWTMTTATCANCLAAPNGSDCSSECTTASSTFAQATSGINEGWAIGDLAGPPASAPPTNVCRVFPQGTADGDYEADQNRSNILSLNAQILGPGGYLTELPADDPQSVWQFYQMVGGIWFDADGSPPPAGSNTQLQRGSIQLANTVMETTFQGTFDPQTGPTANGLNCFVCHNATDYSQTRTSNLSHIARFVNGGTTSTTPFPMGSGGTTTAPPR